MNHLTGTKAKKTEGAISSQLISQIFINYK